MLDSETRARIDSARDILVGKVPDPKSQVAQITIALIYKFMDDMDRQSEELGGKATFFSGEFKKYRWPNLLDRRLGGHERLILYAESIEKMEENANIPQLFRDIFKGVFLPYRDTETLNLFLKEIEGFTYDHSERLGDAYEYLLSVLGTQGDAGQFRTPRHIIDFIVAVVAPQKHETILDPACGTAGFLISAFKHIIKGNQPQEAEKTMATESTKDTKENNPVISVPFVAKSLTPDERGRLMTNFGGYDIAPDMVRLSRVNMYLHGFPRPVIHEYDTLTSEERWDERYDIIMANPPFMTPKGGIRPHNRFAIKAKRSEVLFVDYIAEHLNPGGRAGVIVPEGIIFQSQNAYKQLRRMLVVRGNGKWPMVKLGEVCQINPAKSELKGTDQEIKVSFIPMSVLKEDQPSFASSETKFIQDVINGYTYFRDNDVLLAKITPCFENGKAGIVKGVVNDIGFGSTEFIVLRPDTKMILPELLYYFVKSEEFRKRGITHMTGSAGQQRVPVGFVNSYVKNLFKVIHDRDSMTAQAFTDALEQSGQKIITTALNDVPGRLDKEGKEEKREAQNMAKRFRSHGDAYFKFITTPGLDPY